MSDHGQCYVGVVFIVFCFLLWGGGVISGSHEAAFLCSTAIQLDG